jgi:hypothetical protein
MPKHQDHIINFGVLDRLLPPNADNQEGRISAALAMDRVMLAVKTLRPDILDGFAALTDAPIQISPAGEVITSEAFDHWWQKSRLLCSGITWWVINTWQQWQDDSHLRTSRSWEFKFPPVRYDWNAATTAEPTVGPIAAIPEFETRVQFLRRAQAHYDARVKMVKTRHPAVGATRIRAKRAQRHFEWLVRFQINGETFGSIARRSRTDVRSVSGAVREIANLIALELHATRRGGRPRKNPRFKISWLRAL